MFETMKEKRKEAPEENADRLKNPSPIGTQQSPVSKPRESKNPVEEELEQRNEFERKRKTGDGPGE